MSRARKIMLSLVGLVLAVLISVPLVQKLSIDLMQLQYRERILSEKSTLGDLSASFSIPQAKLAKRLGVAELTPEQLNILTLSQVAARTGRSVRAVKKDVADLTIGEQVKHAYGWTLFLGPDTAEEHIAR